MLSFDLEAAGHQVLAARDGVAGLRSARTSRPDVVLLDLMCPGWTASRYLANCAAQAARRSSCSRLVGMSARYGRGSLR